MRFRASTEGARAGSCWQGAISVTPDALQREAERDLTGRREGHGTTAARSNAAGLEAAGRVMTCRTQGMKLQIPEKEEYSSQGPGERADTLKSDQLN